MHVLVNIDIEETFWNLSTAVPNFGLSRTLPAAFRNLCHRIELACARIFAQYTAETAQLAYYCRPFTSSCSFIV